MYHSNFISAQKINTSSISSLNYCHSRHMYKNLLVQIAM